MDENVREQIVLGKGRLGLKRKRAILQHIRENGVKDISTYYIQLMERNRKKGNQGTPASKVLRKDIASL